METDLSTETLTENGSFMTGGFSSVSDLILLLMKEPLSVDNDLLGGGDGDLGLTVDTDLSSARKGIFGTKSLSVNLDGSRDFLCLSDELLLS